MAKTPGKQVSKTIRMEPSLLARFERAQAVVAERKLDGADFNEAAALRYFLKKGIERMEQELGLPTPVEDRSAKSPPNSDQLKPDESLGGQRPSS